MVERLMRQQRVTGTSGNTAADVPSSAWSPFHVDCHLVAGPAETGKRNDRPQLKQALALCRKNKAQLVIAKLDRSWR